MLETNKMIVIDDNNQEIEMEILFTFEKDDKSKSFVVYTNPLDENGEVFASSYDADGNLFPVEDEKEWEMIEEVFGAYNDELGQEEA